MIDVVRHMNLSKDRICSNFGQVNFLMNNDNNIGWLSLGLSSVVNTQTALAVQILHSSRASEQVSSSVFPVKSNVIFAMDNYD